MFKIQTAFQFQWNGFIFCQHSWKLVHYWHDISRNIHNISTYAQLSSSGFFFRNFINGIRRATKRSSKDVKSSSGGFLENLVNLLMNVLEFLFFEMLITIFAIQIISHYPTYLKHSLWNVWCSTNTFFKLSLGAKSVSMIRTWLNTFMKFWNHSVLSVTLNFNSRIC